MHDIDTRLAANRAAVDDLIAAAERAASEWTEPRAPGKWSPSQVVEHVARSLEEGAHVFAGKPSKFPKLPAIVRPLARGLLFNRAVRKELFPKAKTNRAMDPTSGSATPEEARIRLDDACEAFERECRAHAVAKETVATMTFGRVSVTDYVRFTELHTRHHIRQMPGA